MMSGIHNNTNIKLVQIIQQLQQWNKKPSLNDQLSDFLDIFHEAIKNGQCNFAEAGLLLQESSVLNGKQIDLLYKGFLDCHKNLSDVYNDNKTQDIPKPIEQTLINSNNEINHEKDKDKNKKERKKHETKKPEETQIPTANIEAESEPVPPEIIPDMPDKLSIPGIPDEILEKLKLSDCLPGGPIDEFIDKLDQNHPLYSIISKLGKEISQNKDIFTYNNLSLSGMSWNALFKIEEVLNRTRKDDQLDQNQNKENQIDDDSGIGTEPFLNSECAESSESAENTEIVSTTDLVPISEVSLGPVAQDATEAVPEESVIKKPLELTEELKRQIVRECVEKVAQINLLKLDFNLLTKKFNFRLPSEYFAERRSERIKKKKSDDTEKHIPAKRKKLETFTNLQKIKTFDLEQFENFCYSYYESQGIILPRPEQIQLNRKSIDNRSEVSYGNPLTPADSGRFSLSFLTDSEFEHYDAEDNGRDSNLPFSRADSGIEVMGPFSPGSDCDDDQNDNDELNQTQTDVNEPQNDTLRTLKTLFPATFSDPERAEALKELYKQPEDDANYMQWKKFIDDKTANEQEFNIHEYGGEILNSFASHSTEQLSFETIVEDKSVEDISRYFVSALQLANTYNVEIIDKHPGEIRPDSMQLKFLTDTRAHEEIDSHLNDISEDHFIENLVNSKKYHSTPIQPNVPPGRPVHKITKRRRLEYVC